MRYGDNTHIIVIKSRGTMVRWRVGSFILKFIRFLVLWFFYFQSLKISTFNQFGFDVFSFSSRIK